jgi:hypothetical protein
MWRPPPMGGVAPIEIAPMKLVVIGIVTWEPVWRFSVLLHDRVTFMTRDELAKNYPMQYLNWLIERSFSRF